MSPSNSAQSPADMVAEMWQHQESGDRRRAASYFSPALVWHLFAGERHAMSGDYVGWEETAHLQRLIRAESAGTFHARALDVKAAAPDLAITPIVVTLEAAGEAVEMTGVWIARVAEGLIVEVWDIISSVPESVLRAAAAAVEQLGRTPGAKPR